MRRDFLIHFSFLTAFFTFSSISNGILSLTYWPFWIGGIIGTILPDLDHLIYIYLVRPYELSSVRFQDLVKNKDLKRSVELLYETSSERTNLIFHTLFFQVLFLIVTFWVVSSSGSYFGKGIAMAFSLHLAVDGLIDLFDSDNWNNKIKRNIWTFLFVLTIVMGI